MSGKGPFGQLTADPLVETADDFPVAQLSHLRTRCLRVPHEISPGRRGLPQAAASKRLPNSDRSSFS